MARSGPEAESAGRAAEFARSGLGGSFDFAATAWCKNIQARTIDPSVAAALYLNLAGPGEMDLRVRLLMSHPQPCRVPPLKRFPRCGVDFNPNTLTFVIASIDLAARRKLLEAVSRTTPCKRDGASSKPTPNAIPPYVFANFIKARWEPVRQVVDSASGGRCPSRPRIPGQCSCAESPPA